ncbi:RING/U-box and TRAF domain [Salix suchowensis]|nr:RING/U-box and TRAF domain [Salix suchowensis]
MVLLLKPLTQFIFLACCQHYFCLCVPSEGDLSIEKRKAEDDIESERKRKRRRIKVLILVQHAHGREFIKEYSASHPESSGLKAATKAASDAWKSMSLEEKAKYTKRAREVWDSYLSTAPARTPKPRKQTKLVTRCSPGRLFNVLQRLSAEQRAAVKIMGFGSLLDLRCRTLRRSLCLWLLERFNTAGCSLQICGVHIPLSPRDVEIVLGLAASGKDVINTGPDDLIADLRHSYNATNRGISVRLLEERLAAPEAGEDFKRSFVLYALGTLLSPTARLDVSPSFLHFLTSMDVVHQYNWGKFLLDRLVREVSRFHQGKQRAVGGCLLFLQLFYYESISIEGSCASTSSVTPYLSSWGEEEITEREKRQRELGGYGFGEVICKDRCTGLELSESRGQQVGSSEGKISCVVDHNSVFEQQADQAGKEIMDGNIYVEEVLKFVWEHQVGTESVTRICQNKEYGSNETLDYIDTDIHEETCFFSPCACPLPDCHYAGSSEHCHYTSAANIGTAEDVLGVNEQFLVLQAEEDGVLFLLSKGIESIGNIVIVTCIRPSFSKDRFLYDLVASRGVSSLRLKSLTEPFPGRVEGLPPVDFLLIPFPFLGPSGQLDLEVCIWSSTELGADCS